MEGIDAQVANTGAAGLSFVSFFCLLLVNLGAPIIEGIFITSVEIKLKYSSTGKVIFGVYGVCAKVYSSYASSNNKCASLGLDNTYDDRNGSTKFLLSMHAIAIGGQIDNYLKIKEAVDDDYTTTSIGASGLVPVILALICSLISVFAFYTGDQATANINGPENAATIINQPPVAQYQQPINQPPVSQYGNQPFPPPQPYTNSQYGEYNNFQSPPPQPYPNSQYDDQYNVKQNPYSSPPPPQSPQPYTGNQPYSSTDHEPVMM
nr:82_t:CDS:2 [Entrophospora candida]CAG8571668.1 2554_t:CDS:2 [Entrophospora candida]